MTEPRVQPLITEAEEEEGVQGSLTAEVRHVRSGRTLTELRQKKDPVM